MTIPVSDIVTINPGVIGTGGNPLSLNGVILSQNTLLPSSQVRSFTSSDAVKSFFGPSSAEYAISQVYFAGFDNKTLTPGTLYFAPYVLTNSAAWLQSGSFAGVTLTQLQAIPAGTLIVTVDGTLFTSSSINLSAASSFTNAAALIAAAFTGTGKPTCTWNAVNSTFTLTSTTTGASSTITYATGTISTSLLFTAATGAILSQGEVADTAATAMANVIANTQNWGSFMTLWEPVTAEKTNFAIWTKAQNQRYLYVAWDTDAQAAVNGSTTNFGYLAKTAAYEGVMPVYNTKELAAFVLGTVASIDFNRRNGRITGAFKQQSGLAATVTDQQTSKNLLANGYSYYGAYATAADNETFLYSSQITGKWKWMDTFVNQVYLNAQLQLALISLLTGVNSVPYNESGYSLIRAAMNDPISQALNNGTIRSGVTLSALQIAQVNQVTGRDVSDIIQQTGYYLQVLDPGAQVRGNRGTPVINFFYTDGGAVHTITVASIDIL